MSEVSSARTTALRVVYFLNFVGLGFMAWPRVISPGKPFGLVDGAAFSFWAALAALMGLGLRYPLQMIPLLLLQFFYKAIWFVAVALPLWTSGQWSAGATGMTRTFVMGFIADVLVIPWAYVLANFVR